MTSTGILRRKTLPARQPVLFVSGGVIVVTPEIVSHVAGVVRDSMVALTRMSAGAKDWAAKESAIIDYLRSQEFVVAIRLIAIKIAELQGALQKERAFLGATWTSREQTFGSILRASASIDSRITELLHAAGSRGKENGA